MTFYRLLLSVFIGAPLVVATLILLVKYLEFSRQRWQAKLDAANDPGETLFMGNPRPKRKIKDWNEKVTW